MQGIPRCRRKKLVDLTKIIHLFMLKEHFKENITNNYKSYAVWKREKKNPCVHTHSWASLFKASPLPFPSSSNFSTASSLWCSTSGKHPPGSTSIAVMAKCATFFVIALLLFFSLGQATRHEPVDPRNTQQEVLVRFLQKNTHLGSWNDVFFGLIEIVFLVSLICNVFVVIGCSRRRFWKGGRRMWSSWRGGVLDEKNACGSHRLHIYPREQTLIRAGTHSLLPSFLLSRMRGGRKNSSEIKWKGNLSSNLFFLKSTVFLCFCDVLCLPKATICSTFISTWGVWVKSLV